MSAFDIWTFKNTRLDGKIAVMLDNNIWDWLYSHRAEVELQVELPSDRFALYIPREVEIEHEAIPEHKAIKAFVTEIIEICDVQTTSYFGFATEGPQRRGGFGVGTFIELDAAKRLDHFRAYLRSSRPNGLAVNEADVMLANEAFTCIVITCDVKAGPLRDALNLGGRILHIGERHAVRGTLRTDVERLWGQGDTH